SIYRDRMQSLRQVQARQFVSDFSVSDADVIACAELQGQYCVNLVMIRGGRQLGDKCFFPKNADAEDMEIILEAFVEQHYVSKAMPPLIIVGHAIETTALEEVFTAQAGRRVRINTNPVGDKRVWLKMAQTN